MNKGALYSTPIAQSIRWLPFFTIPWKAWSVPRVKIVARMLVTVLQAKISGMVMIGFHLPCAYNGSYSTAQVMKNVIQKKIHSRLSMVLKIILIPLEVIGCMRVWLRLLYLYMFRYKIEDARERASINGGAHRAVTRSRDATSFPLNLEGEHQECLGNCLAR